LNLLVEDPFNGSSNVVHADSLSLVRFEANDDSMPTKFAHRRVTAIGAIDAVRIAVGNRVVATHRRSWGREGVFYDPMHDQARLEPDRGGPAGLGAGPGRRRRGATGPGAPPRAPGRAVQPRRPPAPEADRRPGAGPHGLREPDGGGGAMKKTETKRTVLLKQNLKALRLPTMIAECEKAARRCDTEDVGHLVSLSKIISFQ
jgi:hypothetical protein